MDRKVTIDLQGRAAIVTGAGRGIGRATALELARLGAGVVVNDIGTATDGCGSDAEPARRVVAEIEAAGGRAVASTDSVADFAAAEKIVRIAVESFGSADILVNNAGLSAGRPIWDLDPDLFQRVCFSHVLGTYNCTRSAVPHMKERGWGRVVNLVSRAGLIGMAGNAAYGAGKGGIFGFTNVISRELAPFGITVNAVNPSSTHTRMVTEAVEKFRAQGGAAEKQANTMLASLQAPENVAVLIAALCTEPSAGVNGQIFYVAGREVGLFRPLAVTQTQSREEPWTSEDLARALSDFELHPLDTPYS